MSFVNQPEIIAGEVYMRVLVGWAGPIPKYLWRHVGYNMTPLDRTWYEEEVDTVETRTFRFAKRSDHTNILIKIDNAEFYKLPGDPL